MNEEKQQQFDHDLLIRIDQQVKDIHTSLKEIKENTIGRLNGLEKDKADRKDVEALQKIVNEDIEVRVHKLELSVSRFLTTLALYSIAVGGMIALIVYHILKGN